MTHILFTLFLFICEYWCLTHIILCCCFFVFRLLYPMLRRQKLLYMTKTNSACASPMQFTSSLHPPPPPHKIDLLFHLLQHSTRYNLYIYVDTTWWRLHVKSKTPISIFRTLETYWKILWWWRTNACFIAESVLAIANLRADIRTKDWWGIWYEIGYVMIFFLYSGTVWYIYIYILYTSEN
jgi:hypothetical protein